MEAKIKISDAIKYLKAARDKVEAICSIEQEYNYDELNIIYQRTPITFKGLFALPYLKKKSYQSINTKGKFIRHKNIVESIGFIAFLIERNERILNQFVRYQAQYENYLLLGNYDEAQLFLDKINEEISYSIWSLSNKIKLLRLKKEENEAFSFYNRECMGKKTIINVFGHCALKTSSIEYFPNNEINALQQIIRNVKDEDYRSFIIIHSFPYMDGIKGNWFPYCTITSIIDLYLSLRNNLWNLPQNIYEDNSFRRYIQIIRDTIDDEVIHKFCFLLNISGSKIERDEERETILQYYYKSKYQEVFDEGYLYLQKHPTDMHIVDLVCRSMTNLDESCLKLATETPLQLIITHYYYYIKKNASSKLDCEKLQLICKSLYSIISLRDILIFIEGFGKNDIREASYNSWQYSLGGNITDMCYYNSKDEQLDYLNRWNPSDVSYYRSLIYEENLHDKDFLNLQISRNDDNFTTNCLIEKWKDNLTPCYYRNTVASQIFLYYFSCSMWKDSILFYVRNKIEHQNLNIRIVVVDVLSKIEKANVDDWGIPLEVSIFYTMLDSNPSKRYLAYKHYLKQINLSKASDIQNIDNEAKRYFLRYVADLKVLGLHRKEFKSQDDVVKERISICKKLYIQEPEVGLSNEIATLEKDRQIKSLIKQVDDSKIFVDVEGIRKNEIMDEEALFSIFQATENNMEYQNQSLKALLDVLHSQNIAVYIFDSQNNESTNYKYSLFQNFFIMIRDKFLWDPKYGLDFYLSTRIRHGTLVNQLRKHFQENKLVTNKNELEAYNLNTYWIDECLKLTGTERELCILEFQNLTNSIDSRIFKIKDQYIQIKTETTNQEKEAGFDFSYQILEDYIKSLACECSEFTFEECFDKVISFLWGCTENCLERLRESLDKEQAEMQEMLSQFISKIYQIVGNGNPNMKRLEESVTLCGTDLQQDFSLVKRWLVRRNSNSFDFTMKDVVTTSLRIINNMNTTKINPKITYETVSLIKGNYFNHIYDLFHELLNNILNYQKTKTQNVHSEIKIKEDGDILVIVVSNWIDANDAETIRRKVAESEAIFSELRTNGQVRKEGHSGILKLKNLVSNVLPGTNNQYTNKIDNNLYTVEVILNKRKLCDDKNLTDRR